MRHRLDTPHSNTVAIIQARAADDPEITSLALRLYIALMSGGAWNGPIRVYSADYAERFHVSHARVAAMLRVLDARGYITRRWQRGWRYQLVEAPKDGAKE